VALTARGLGPTSATRARGEPEPGRRRRAGAAFLLLLPAFGLLAAVVGYPIVRAIWLSFHTENARGTQTDVFVGLGNYLRALAGPDAHEFWNSVTVTAFFAVTTVAAELIVGFLLALIMHRRFRGRGLVRASVLVPWAIPTAVSAVLWQWMLQPDGIVNAVLGHHIIWTGQTWSSRLGIIIADTWKTAPFISLLVLAAMQAIPDEVYEAARVDGTSAWQRTWRITVPMVKPALAVAVLFRVLDALRMYDLPAILTHGANGTTTMSIFAYQQAINQGKFGYGSALSTLTFILIFLVGLAFVRLLSAHIAEATGAASR
jgi:ABC-type sugar transport system permease subunit